MKSKNFEYFTVIVVFFLIIFLIALSYLNPNEGKYIVTYQGIKYNCKNKTIYKSKFEKRSQ